MSSFVPLNIIEDPSVSKKDIEAEHTRELQVEQAFQLFNESIRLQKQGILARCYQLNESIFKIEVISNHYYEEEDYIKGVQNGGENTIVDELNFLSPNVKSLRYLVFRNRALLYLEMLKSRATIVTSLEEEIATSGTEDSDSSDFPKLLQERTREMFYTMLDDLGIALIYQEADRTVLETLFELLLYLCNNRLAKYILEYTISGKTESDDILGLLPVDKAIKRHYNLLVRYLNTGKSSQFEKLKSKVDGKYSFLDSLRDDFFKQLEHITTLRVIDCHIRLRSDKITWEDIVTAISDRIKKNEDKSRIESVSRSKLKDIDPYFFSSESIDVMRIEIPREYNPEEVEMPEVDEPNGVLEVNDDMEGQENAQPAQPQTDEIKDEKDENDKEDEIKDEIKDETQGETEKPELESAVKEEAKEQINDNLDADVVEIPPPDYLTSKEGTASPTKSQKASQRASKRLQKDIEPVSWLPDIALVPEMFQETTTFFERLNSFLEQLNFPEARVVDLSYQFCNPQALIPFIGDFVRLLELYRPPRDNPTFFLYGQEKLLEATKTDTENERLKLLEVLRSFDVKPDGANDSDPVSLEDHESNEIIVLVINSMNEKNLHANDTRIFILRHLLGFKEDGSCLICDRKWLDQLLATVKQWIIQLEEQIFLKSSAIMATSEIPLIEELVFCVSIFEAITDMFVSSKEKVDLFISQNPKKGFLKSTRLSLNVQGSELSKLRSILERWTIHIEAILFRIELTELAELSLAFKLLMRFKWACSYKQKAENANFESSKFISAQLMELSELANQNPQLKVPMLNYDCISELQLSSIVSMIDTVTVLTLFAKIVYAKDEENNDEAVNLLERTLIDSKYFLDSPDVIAKEDIEAITSIKKFLGNSRLEMRINLWNILFLYYNRANKFDRFQFGFERHLEFIFSFINSENYLLLSNPQRCANLLILLANLNEYLVLYLRHLDGVKWSLDDTCDLESAKESLSRLLLLFQMVYTFSLHEEASLITSRRESIESRAKNTYKKFKAVLLRVTTVMLVYYDFLARRAPNVDNDSSLQLLSVVHEQFGIRRLCEAGDGILLQMIQDKLLYTDPFGHRNEMLQILACRYHCNIPDSSFSPSDHDTIEVPELTNESAFEIAKFVLPLCLKHEPLKNIPRGDLKNLIDGIYDMVGDPEPESSKLVTQNSALISHFLDETTISPSFLRNAFHGLLRLELNEVDDSLSKVVKNGLYYLEGLLVLSSYKARKKSMQGRSLELTHVVKLLTNDLIYNTGRVESWLLLGQSYGFLLEDDLIWTSDKLNIIDRKISTANLQRKALLCYLMAISFSKTYESDDSKFFIGELMASFAQELFNSITGPMNMLAFKVTMTPLFVYVDDHHIFRSLELRPCIKKSLCLKVAQQSLHLSIKSKPTEWLLYYCLSKVQDKLDLPSDLVITTLLEACKYSKGANIPELVVEPHYKLCSMLYKFVKRDKIPVEKAIEFAHGDEMFTDIGYGQLEETVDDKTQFYTFIIECLKKIEHADKKKWHHKYRYRMACIYQEEFDNIEEALKQMNTIISLKPTSKSLIQIWKPDNERPGKHFVYTFQYAMVYIDLLAKDRDLGNLLNMVPRLRKSNSTMISLNITWEKLCSTICKLVRGLFKIKDDFTETFLNTPYPLFLAQSKHVLDTLKGNALPETIVAPICILNSVNEIKKLNNGFGPTSLIDDTSIALYITIFNSIDKMETPLSNGTVPESPSGKVKRLAKKDIFPFINDILKNSKREIDAVLKDQPDVFNDFVKSVDTKQEDKGDRLTPPAIQIGETVSPSGKSASVDKEKTPEPNAPADTSTDAPVDPSRDIPAGPVENGVNGTEENGTEAKNGNTPIELANGIHEPIQIEVIPEEPESKRKAEEEVDNDPKKHKLS